MNFNDTNPTVIFMMGLPGSDKSTLLTNTCELLYSGCPKFEHISID